MANPKNLFDDLKVLCDSWNHKNAVMKAPVVKPLKLFGFIPITSPPKDITIDIHCTSTAAAVSFVDPQDPKKLWDAFLLSFDFAFHSSGSRIPAYFIGARILSDATMPVSAQDSPARSITLHSDKDSRSKEWLEDFEQTQTWRKEDKPTLSNSFCIKSAPDNLSNTTSFTVQTSLTLGGQIGIFDPKNSAQINASYQISDSKTVNVVCTKIMNLSSSDHLDIRFFHQDETNRDSTFQPYVQCIFQVEDDRQGPRSNNPAEEGKEIAIELTASVVPSEHVYDTTMDRVLNLFGGSRTQAVTIHTFTRVFKLRLPPLPTPHPSK